MELFMSFDNSTNNNNNNKIIIIIILQTLCAIINQSDAYVHVMDSSKGQYNDYLWSHLKYGKILY